MESNKEIKVGVGLGLIKFGWSKEKLIELLGEPDEKESVGYPVSEDEELFTESWHYDDPEISVSFDEDFDGSWRLGTIAVSSEEFTFNGQTVVGLDKTKFEKMIPAFGLGEFITEDLSTDESPNIKLISFEENSINFWFEADVLTEVQWGPLFDEEEENPIWPDMN